MNDKLELYSKTIIPLCLRNVCALSDQTRDHILESNQYFHLFCLGRTVVISKLPLVFPYKMIFFKK